LEFQVKDIVAGVRSQIERFKESVESYEVGTVVQVGDRIVLFAAADAVAKVEKMFSVQLEYF